MPMEITSPVLHTMDLRLSYADCDPAGIVYFAAYQWMERVYNEWTHAGGHTPDLMPELWGATHISRASGCEYLVPGMLFDAMTCEMRLGKVGRTSFTTVYDFVRHSDGATLARGHIVFVFVADDGTPTPVPEGFKDVVRAAGADV